MYKWYLPTLSEIIQCAESDLVQHIRGEHPSNQSEQQWYGAIAALNTLLPQCHRSDGESTHQLDSSIKGLIISGPFPIISQIDLGEHFSTWTLTVDPSLRMGAPQLPAAETMASSRRHIDAEAVFPSTEQTLLLHPDDPLAVEPFCLVLTPQLNVVLTLGLDDKNRPQFFFSFDPDTIWQGWRSLQSRLQLTTPSILPRIERIADQFVPTTPDFHIVTEFGQLMMLQAPARNERRMRRHPSTRSIESRTPSNHGVAYEVVSVQEDKAESEAMDGVGLVGQTEQAGNTGQPNRYPSKPLNVNRVGRLKLDAFSWKDVVGTGKRGDKPADGAQNEAQNGAGQGMRSHRAESVNRHSSDAASMAKNEKHQAQIGSDVELLKAIAHEVRTPLTTIRTLTRLLMKRKDLVDVVLKRLEQIDRECTKQIDRFSLIFKAVELETASTNQSPSHLARISLVNMFQQNVTRWKQQAQQRNLTLDVALPPTLPFVMSDPTILDQVLTGLMDRMTHTLPPGTLIQLNVVPAGHQLKLQFWAKPQLDEDSCKASFISHPASRHSDRPEKPEKATTTADSYKHSIFAPTLQSVGQLLMFQPETGNLSLNLDVTKNLFQSLGGKFIVRHTPSKGEVLTIFLPLDDTDSKGLSPSLKGKYFC
ncbi:MAG: histidine kinase dimerization/phospho-acceptor domain-containing protein [Cyanobacteria bacterium P01_F01_bin.150]